MGCGTGVFSGLLALHFQRVLAIDISGEALRIAAEVNRGASNVQFLRRDLRKLAGNGEFDLIVCAEILYYLRESDSQAVCQALDRLLGKYGVILTVSGSPKANTAGYSCYFNGWNEILSRRFATETLVEVTDTRRPYRIAGFSRRNARTK